MPYKGPDRRHGPDLLVRTFHRLSVAVLVTNFMIVVAVGIAKPRLDTMFDKFAGNTVTGSWDPGILGIVSILLVIQFFISGTGLILNILRHHRKRDHYSASLIFSIIVSIAGFIIMNA